MASKDFFVSVVRNARIVELTEEDCGWEGEQCTDIHCHFCTSYGILDCPIVQDSGWRTNFTIHPGEGANELSHSAPQVWQIPPSNWVQECIQDPINLSE